MKLKPFRNTKIKPFLLGLFLFIISPTTLISAPIEVPFDDSQLEGIVKDNDWLLVLGRAAFWDQQMGSDGGACANCHFSAGADNRLVGQANPAFKAFGVDTEFGCTQGSDCITGEETGSGGTAGPHYKFVEADFPFRQFEGDVIDDRNAPIRINSNDVLSSAGSFDTEFFSTLPGEEECGPPNKDIFHIESRRTGDTYALRAVEPRNTPTVVNAAMNHRNFMDGRASNLFNGVGVFGLSDIEHDPNARLIKLVDGLPTLTHLEIRNASIASLSVGPILDNLEMSCDGRRFADVARKVYGLRALKDQLISRADSVFGRNGPHGELIHSSRRGLKAEYTYEELIKLAFEPEWWEMAGSWKIESGALSQVGANEAGYTQMELNFPMFWGLALQRHQQTLISDQSKFDIAENAGCFLDEDEDGVLENIQACIDSKLWTEEEEIGRQVFFGATFAPVEGAPNPGNCSACHGGNMFTAAALENDGTLAGGIMNRNVFGPPGSPSVLVDTGFFNTGANVIEQDLGQGGTDKYGIPLSFVRQLLLDIDINEESNVCNVVGNAPFCDEEGNVVTVPDINSERIEVDGAIKSPTMRNIGLTPPYFHYGGYSNLRQVMEFYNRGGSRRDLPEGCDPELIPPTPGACGGDSSGSGPLGQTPIDELDPNNRGTNVAGIVTELNLTDEEMDATVAFMLTLTDPRVACDAAPFDHPELRLFVDARARDNNEDDAADDVVVRLPAVGFQGYAPRKPELCIPNKGDLFARGMGARVRDRDR